MSTFVTTLENDRARLLAIIKAAEAELATARPIHERAKAALDEYRSKPRGSGHSERGHLIYTAEYDARNVAVDLERQIERARNRIAEIDELLAWESDLADARKGLGVENNSLREASATEQQMTTAIADIEGELEELRQRLSDERTKHSKALLAGRLAGQKVATPKVISEIENDIASRELAIAEATTVRDNARAVVESRTTEYQRAKVRLHSARRRQNEVAAQDAVASIQPVLAMLQATGSYLFEAVSGMVKIPIDKEQVRAATKTLADEIANA